MIIAILLLLILIVLLGGAGLLKSIAGWIVVFIALVIILVVTGLTIPQLLGISIGLFAVFMIGALIYDNFFNHKLIALKISIEESKKRAIALKRSIEERKRQDHEDRTGDQ